MMPTREINKKLEQLPPQPIEELVEEIERLPALGKVGNKLAGLVHKAVLGGGHTTRRVADLLHGTWLGHPLHPMLTDLTIGAWAYSAFFDAVAALSGASYARRAADVLATAGTATAVPTLLSGLADYSTTTKSAIPTATLHGLLNNVNFALYLLSIRDRRRGNRSRGVFFSSLAVALTLVSAWLGGRLIYREKVGVNHSPETPGPVDWTPIIDAAELPEQKPMRVEADGTAVLLYRCEGDIYAVGAVCAHAGGPLEEGTFDGCYVECPWHQSVFNLRDGGIRHGPATAPQPSYDVREQNGQIEVRLRL